MTSRLGRNRVIDGKSITGFGIVWPADVVALLL